MFRQLPQSYVQRQMKTSEPRFKRLSRITSPDNHPNKTFHQNFPTVNKGNAFDNSKQNLQYETHLAKVRSACKLDETTIVSRYLNTIRKDYDEMNKVSKREINTVKMKKREIEFMRQKTHAFVEKRLQLEKKIVSKQKETNQIKQKYEDSKMQTKTLENIIVRMKKDQIFYKQFGRIKDQQLKKKAKQLKVLDENLIHEEEKLHRLGKDMSQYQNLYSKNKDVRQKKFQDFSGKISDVRERDRFIQQRKERTYELQSIELNDTLDQKNIHMRQIILAHKVADSLLQSKVNTLIKKYSDIQTAFHLVKIKTCVSQPQLLTSKFFSYEQTSQNLLESINDKQLYAQSLKNKKAELLKSYKQVSYERLAENSQLLLDSQRPPRGTWKLKINEQINNKMLILEQINNWTNRKMIQIDQQQVTKDLPLDEKLKLICQFINENAKKYQNYELSDQKIETMGVRMKKLVKELTAEQLSLRLRETQDMNDSNIVQEQYIKTARQSVLKKAFNIKHYKRQSNK